MHSTFGVHVPVTVDPHSDRDYSSVPHNESRATGQSPVTAAPNRRPARFFYISDRLARPVAGDGIDHGLRVAWRLMAGNNRPLGRSAVAYYSLRDAVEAARYVAARANDLRGLTFIDDPRGVWRWRATIGGTPVAAAVVHYARRLDCERALRQFADAVSNASTEPEDLRPLGPSALRAYDIDDSSSIALG
jgi:hypothetical protein